MEKRIFIIIAMLILWAHNVAWCDEAELLPEDKPVTVNTGTRTGCVTDAITGKPLEGAIVVYNWDIRDFSFEGGNTRFGAVYECITDKNGKYTIPSQSVEIEHSLFSRLAPEQAFVYKFGYVWYRMSDKEVMPFLAYVPNLPQIYKKQNNIVKLQPWNDGMSHTEHLKFIPSHQLPKDKLQLLPEALAEEKILAEEEQKANENFLEKVAGAKKQLANNTKAYKKKQVAADEYINRLHDYLTIPDSGLLKSVSLALKDCNDSTAIPVLIDFLKENIWHRKSFEEAFYSLRFAINNRNIKCSTNVPDRKKLLEEIENWWELNKTKSTAEWNSDDLTKFSHLLEVQANSWRPLYDILGEFQLISGEVEDANDSPVMTIFKKFKAALIADDVNTALDCFIGPAKEDWAKILKELQPKLREMANGMKQMVMVSENEYEAKYDLLSPGEDGRMYAFPISFVRDEIGQWKISDF